MKSFYSTLAKLFRMEKDLFIRRLIVLCFFLFSFFWKPLFVFFIPGILILFVPAFKEIDLIECIAFVLGLSLSFWIASFWFLNFLPFALSTFFTLVLIISVLLVFFFSFMKPNFSHYKINTDKFNLILLLLFLFLLFLRLLPLTFLIVPTGADMSMHSYITELIIFSNGVPKTYFPLIGLDSFDAFPVGFHSVAALISQFGHIPSYSSALILSCFTYFLLTFFLFIFLKNHLKPVFAFVSAVAFTFFTVNPQGFTAWGANPAILSLAFVFLFIAFLDRIEEKNWFLILFSALTLTSVFLVHTAIFIQSFYIIGLSFFVFLLLSQEYKNKKWFSYFAIAILFFLLIVPYLFSLNSSMISNQNNLVLRDYLSGNPASWQGSIADALWDIPFYNITWIFSEFHFSLIGVFVFSLLFCIIGLYFLFKEDLIKAIQYLLFLGLISLLILNVRVWILPFSFLIYPEKVALMVVIPFSLFFGFGLQKLAEKISDKKTQRIISVALLFVVLLTVPFFNQVNYEKPLIQQNSVTESDLKAFSWLKENTSETTVIQNNYGDSGIWIPSVIFRPITSPHINIFYLNKVKWFSEPEYIFIGKKCVYSGKRTAFEGTILDYCSITKKALNVRSDIQLVYSEDGVFIYKIL